MGGELSKVVVLMVPLLFGCGAESGRERPASGTASQAEQPVPPDLRADIARSIAVGSQLYVLDKVAAIGTDVLFANVQHPEAQGVVGYVPLREGDADGRGRNSYLVSFFTEDDPPRVAYEIRVLPDAQPEFQAFAPPKDVPPGFAALIRARQAAIAAMPTPKQPINPVVIPGEVAGEVLVYLLAGTKQPDLAVFGQHFRAVVAMGGSSVRSMTPLSNTVLEVPTRAPNGEPAEGLAVSHAVTDFPLETHVFTSLLHQKVVYVGTRRGMWRVEGDKISFLGKAESKAAE